MTHENALPVTLDFSPQVKPAAVIAEGSKLNSCLPHYSYQCELVIKKNKNAYSIYSWTSSYITQWLKRHLLERGLAMNYCCNKDFNLLIRWHISRGYVYKPVKRYGKPYTTDGHFLTAVPCTPSGTRAINNFNARLKRKLILQ